LDTSKLRVIEKIDCETSKDYGIEPEKRSIEEHINLGIINLDKFPNPTSHLISDFVKKVLNVNKAGHSGTLDPKVTGVLPVAINKATKILQSLLVSGKEYVCLMHIHREMEKKEVERILMSFLGEITQLPPVRSSIKRVERQRNIYYITILDFKDKDILFKVGCQAGTYIRKLCHDFGVKTGFGAHMQELRRTRVACLDETKNLVNLHELSEAKYIFDTQKNEKYLRYCIQPIENAAEHLKKMWILDSAVASVAYGAKLKVPGVARFHEGIKKGEMIGIMSLKNELVALGTAEMDSEEIKKRNSGIAASLKRVVMEKDVYPRMWETKTKSE